MKNFQKAYEELLHKQQVTRDFYISKWELYEHKEEIEEFLASKDPGLAVLTILPSSIYLNWYIRKCSVEDAIKYLLEYFNDMEYRRKKNSEIFFDATFINHKVKITLNLSSSANCRKVHVDDKIEPVYEYICN